VVGYIFYSFYNHIPAVNIMLLTSSHARSQHCLSRDCSCVLYSVGKMAAQGVFCSRGRWCKAAGVSVYLLFLIQVLIIFLKVPWHGVVLLFY